MKVSARLWVGRPARTGQHILNRPGFDGGSGHPRPIHTGLTYPASTGATTAELMRRGGHASPAAALRYQHASAARDRAIANALGDLASGRVVPMGRTNDGRSSPSDPANGPSEPADQGDSWQPQRDSNPCLHLERVVS